MPVVAKEVTLEYALGHRCELKSAEGQEFSHWLSLLHLVGEASSFFWAILTNCKMLMMPVSQGKDDCKHSVKDEGSPSSNNDHF